MMSPLSRAIDRGLCRVWNRYGSPAWLFPSMPQRPSEILPKYARPPSRAEQTPTSLPSTAVAPGVRCYGTAYVFSIYSDAGRCCCRFLHHQPSTNHGPFRDSRISDAHLAVPAYQRWPASLTTTRYPASSKASTVASASYRKLDAKGLNINDIKDSVSEYFNHLIRAPIAQQRHHYARSLPSRAKDMTRRYMWKLDF